jgi:dTDP-4-dehydrorhamnose reductase
MEAGSSLRRRAGLDGAMVPAEPPLDRSASGRSRYVKLVVTGAGGGLGRAFLQQMPGHHDVHAFTHGELDVGDHHAVMKTIVPLRPEAVLNFAALTNVDACESEPAQAFRDNALAAQSLALATRAAGAVLLHVSTDYVFDGHKERPYDECDPPNPGSVYARSKLAGETFVRRLTPEHLIVRTGYLFGSGSDYFTSQLQRLSEGKVATGLADRIGSPTYVPHLAARLLPLLLAGRFGTYHLAGPEPCSWFDVLTRAKRLAGLPGEIVPQEAASLVLPAPRPKYSALTSLFAGAIGIVPLPPLDAALAELLTARVRQDIGVSDR